MGTGRAPLSPLQWMAPELARAGLVRNENWVTAHTKRATALFVNQGMHASATLLAALHIRAIDYLEQAPVLALAATYGNKTSRKQDRAFIGMNFGPQMERGAKLRDVMATYRVAYPLRAISGNAIRPNVWEVLRRVSELVDPSSIAQAIPADPKRHMFWLNDLSELWAILDRRLAERGADYRAAVLRWAMLALSRAEAGKRFPKDEYGAPARRDDVARPGEIADFLIAEQARFNPRWTWARMVQETRDWHEALANAQIDHLNDGTYDEEVNYGPFPVERSVGGFDFHALRSLRSLIIEGKAMHHCVASYYPDVVNGRCRIYSVRKDGRRVATAEFLAFPNPRAVQVQGVCNLLPTDAVRKAADQFAKRLHTFREPRP